MDKNLSSFIYYYISAVIIWSILTRLPTTELVQCGMVGFRLMVWFNCRWDCTHQSY